MSSTKVIKFQSNFYNGFIDVWIFMIEMHQLKLLSQIIDKPQTLKGSRFDSMELPNIIIISPKDQ